MSGGGPRDAADHGGPTPGADVEEAQRRWKLRCIAAEAELGELQAMTGLRATLGGRAALQASEVAGTGSSADEDELEIEVALSQVLALEEHLQELGAWEQQVQLEADAARATVEASEAGLRACLQSAGAGRRARLDEELAQEEATLHQLREAKREAEAEASGARLTDLQRARLVQRHEAPAAPAQRAGRPQSSSLGRAQREGVRLRGKCERGRRRLEAELSVCRSELASAASRASAAGDELRRARARHGRRIGELRASSEDLHLEVGQEFLSLEAFESELWELLHEERSLEEAAARTALQELQAHQANEALRAQLAAAACMLGSEHASAEVSHRRLHAVEEDRAHAERESCCAVEAARGLEGQLSQVDRAWDVVRGEVDELRSAWGAKRAARAAGLRAAEAQLDAEAAVCSALGAESARLREDTAVAEHSNGQRLATLRTALRRSGRLRAAQTELERLAPAGGPAPPGAQTAIAEEVYNWCWRLCSSLEPLALCLGGDPTPETKAILAQWRARNEASRRASNICRAEVECADARGDLDQCRRVLALERARRQEEEEQLRARLDQVGEEAGRSASLAKAEMAGLLARQRRQRDELQAEVAELLALQLQQQQQQASS